MKYPSFIALLALALISPGLRAEDKPAAPVKKTEAAKDKTDSVKDEAGWYTDYAEAQKAAAKEKKPIIMLFTGSDWCHWCIKLEKQILGEEAFKTWAAKKVVLYKADSKGGASHLSAENKKMMDGYGAQGFPTIVITDAKGKSFGTTGYRDTTPKDYNKHLEEIIASKGRNAKPTRK